MNSQTTSPYHDVINPHLSRLTNWTTAILLPTATATAVAGISRIISAITFGALLFGSTNPDYVLTGIAMMLTGALVIGLIVACFSSRPTLIASPQDAPAIMVATLSISLATILPTGESLATLIAIAMIITFLTGVTLLGMGWLRLGRIVRYVPSFVSGGFVAATGWFLTQGALTTMVGMPLNPTTITHFLTPVAIAQWLPALLGALFLLVIARRRRHPLALPGAVLLLALIFMSWRTIQPQSAAHGSWLLSPHSQTLATMNPLMHLVEIAAGSAQIDWLLILSQTQTIVSVVIICAVLLMVNAQGFALSTGQKVDMNHELKIAGVANLCSALCGGFTGYHVLSNSVIVHKLGARNRWSGVGAALICGAVLFGGSAVLSHIPKAMLGSLLLFIGLNFLFDWLVDGWRVLSHRDYALMVLLLLIVVGYGFVAGVLVGMALVFVSSPDILRRSRKESRLTRFQVDDER